MISTGFETTNPLFASQDSLRNWISFFLCFLPLSPPFFYFILFISFSLYNERSQLPLTLSRPDKETPGLFYFFLSSCSFSKSLTNWFLTLRERWCDYTCVLYVWLCVKKQTIILAWKWHLTSLINYISQSLCLKALFQILKKSSF